MKLQIRMNTKKKCVELKTSQHTLEKTALQRGVDFLKAFMMGTGNSLTKGFEIDDAVALLRLDDLYIESFEIKDGSIPSPNRQSKPCMAITCPGASAAFPERKAKPRPPSKTPREPASCSPTRRSTSWEATPTSRPRGTPFAL